MRLHASLFSSCGMIVETSKPLDTLYMEDNHSCLDNDNHEDPSFIRYVSCTLSHR